ncbi:MAG: hypothetical protein ACRDA3_06305 [Peptostreptococcaceae bacterium]
MIEYINNLKIINNIFGINRIVDSENKKIISINDGVNQLNNHQCFDF